MLKSINTRGLYYSFLQAINIHQKKGGEFDLALKWHLLCSLKNIFKINDYKEV